MKSLKINFEILLKSTLILVCVIFVSFTANASGEWTATYKVSVSGSRSTGSGTVYMSSTAYTNKDKALSEENKGKIENVQIIEANSLGIVTSSTVEVSSNTSDVLSLSKTIEADDGINAAIRYTSIVIHATPDPGSKYLGYYYGDEPLKEGDLSRTDVYVEATKDKENKAQSVTITDEKVFYPVFVAKTYYRQTPKLGMAVYVPAVGESEEQWVVTEESSIGQVKMNSGAWCSKIDTYGVVSQQGNGVDDAANISYTIEAEAKEGYGFRGWFVHNDDGTYREIAKDAQWESTQSSSSWLSESDPYVVEGLDDKVIYAHFAEERDYYHGRAKVGIATTGEDGQVYVSAEEIADIEEFTDWPSLEKGVLFTSNEENKGSTTSDVITELNAYRYDYFFYAKPLDAEKVAFKGWTTNVDGSNVTQISNPYQALHSASVDENDPHIPTTMYAVFRSYYYAKPHVIAVGGGRVSLDNNENNALEEIDDIIPPVQVAAKGDYHDYNYTIYAHEVEGTRFVGWSKSKNERDILDADREITAKVVSGRTSSISSVAPHRVTWYAIFKSDIDIKHADRLIYYEDNQGKEYINDAKIIVDVYNAATLEVQLEGADAELFRIMDASLTQKGSSLILDATQGLIDLRLKYIGEEPFSSAIGKSVVVNFTSKDLNGNVRASLLYSCVVEQAPVITFLPTDGLGSYTISHTDGSGVSYELEEDAEYSQQVIVTHENMSYLTIELEDNEDDDMEFFAWEIVEDGEPTGEYLSYDKLFTYHFEESVTLRAEFVRKGLARYVIKSDYITNGDNAIEYYDLKDAIEEAEKGSSVEDKTIVVHRNGLLPKDNYQIPAGVTLLVPYESTYVCTTSAKSQSGYQWVDSGDANGDGVADIPLPDATCFRKLTVEEGARITVKNQGNICVEAKLLIYGQVCISQPYIYGQLELRSGALIDLESGANLFAWGYVTNPEETKVNIHNMKHVGRVNAQSGAMVWEVFQFNDFRGGSATINFVQLSGIGSMAGLLGFDVNGYLHEVFPINQYYIKNIEAPIQFNRGSFENLAMGVYAGEVYTTTSVNFLGTNNGLFKWGESLTATLTKYYDASTDRQELIIGDTQKGNTSMTFGEIVLNLNLKLSVIDQNVEINSKDYVMTLNNNMDIIIQNANVLIPKGINIALLAGASVHVDKDSKVVNRAEIYVYDKDQNTFSDGSGYYGSTDTTLIPIYPNHRPYGRKFNRTIENLQDARFVVDGELDCSGGYLITTQSGASIISNGGGKITIGNFGSPSVGSSSNLKRNQSVYQYDQTASSYIEIPLSTYDNKYYPKLQHGDNSYLTATSARSYYYCSGIWGTEVCSDGGGYSNPYVDNTPFFTISDPWTITAYVGESSQTGGLLINEGGNTSSDRTYSAIFTGRDANLFSFDVENKQITFTPASAGTKNAVMILTATCTVGGNEYKHTQAINVVGNARSQEANTLAFNDFSTLWVGQTGVNLYAGKNNNNPINVILKDNNGNVIPESDIILTPSNGVFNALKEGSVTIVISQESDNTNHIAGTELTTTIKVNPRVVWNWGTLYYPSENTNPITMMDGTKGWTLTEIIDPKSGDVVKFEGEGSTDASPNSTYIANIFDLINGKYKVQFKFHQEGYQDIIFDSEIYRDPRRLRVTVNNDTIFKGITIGSAEGVEYSKASKQVSITSGDQNINSWTIHYLGIPDKIYFVPIGDKAWQIEESQDGLTWIATLSWTRLESGENFDYSLMPSTQYVRISYAAGGTGILRDVYITKLEGVKLNPEKLYMPAIADAKKHVAVTYVSDTPISISDPNGEFIASPSSSSATTSEPYYNVVDVVVENESCDEEKLTHMNISSSIGTVQLPIQAYAYPQELPIVLSSDDAERFYYVSPYNYQATWREDRRTITMHNAVAKAQPYVVFHYKGVPTYISFEHPTSIKGNWIVEKSEDGIDWTLVTEEPVVTDVENGKLFKQDISGINTASSYLRVTYDSYYAENVDISDLRIIGEKGAFVSPSELTVQFVSNSDRSGEFILTALNLETGFSISTDNTENFTLTCGEFSEFTEKTFSTSEYPGLAESMLEIPFRVYFDGDKAVDYATITITDNPSEGNTAKVLAKVKVTGVRKTLTSGVVNIYTGVPEDITDANGDVIKEGYNLIGTFVGSTHQELNISSAFAGGSALFDYLFIFGETTTTDGTTVITTPTSLAGSNAKTPCYIYEKKGVVYEYHSIVENANSGTKITQDFLKLSDAGEETLSVYITGFCPYASTGYTKEDEGVFFFQGGESDNVHVYLEDCYLYSRSKTDNGRFFENRADGQSFTEYYVKGSGGVLVFECSNDDNEEKPFNVTIHTRGTNMLKSHYGCFLESVAGRAYQVSSPVQVHMKDETFILASYTTLSFDDIWPIAGETTERTNGFISLQKQVNNAPSIDMGNANTVVNFNGGQVELQNAQNVSDNYTSTLAISHREGTFAGFRLAYGLGSDGVGGTVKFNDGTTTVITMPVEERFRNYYLMDEDGVHTSCLRCPQNTYVYGGSHCMMRACSEPTSKGGAPSDGENPLAKFEYSLVTTGDNADVVSETTGLVEMKSFPNECYSLYYANETDKASYPNNTYGLQSVTPVDGKLNLWLPDIDCSGFDVEPEVDQKVSFWKACMTEIGASYAGYGGVIGGDIKIGMEGEKQTELVSNLLYCTIDQNIHDVIRGDYSAPVKSPLPSGDAYLYVKPTSVGANKQHYVLNNNNYQIENKIYYITTATADTWMTFTAPFDVADVYIMETCNEDDLVNCSLQTFDPISDESGEEVIVNPREETLKLQARYNADFAAFFGVAMAIHPNKTFDQIYGEYKAWAGSQNIAARKYPLIPYRVVVDENGKKVGNWKEANCYIYQGDNWLLNDSQTMYDAQWGFLNSTDIMMEQGKTYSILLPYCVGCDNSLEERQEWDYWSGKFLIFESTNGPHIINGGSFVGTMVDEKHENGKIEYQFVYDQIDMGKQNTVFAPGVSSDKAILTGNSTFAQMRTQKADVWSYTPVMNYENFYPAIDLSTEITIEPSTAFLLAAPITNSFGMRARFISRTGEIVYPTGDNNGDGTPTGGENVPTVGGGSDIFVTSVAEGINIAVSEPQYVGVFSATGALLYSGWVETSVDVNLVVNGVYVVVGENNSVKVIY